MISIVVPVYNAGRFIRETVDTVLHQTYRDWELILVDDCSSDDSVAVIEEIIRTHPEAGIRLIRGERNEGAAAARNRGTKTAEGRYLAFLDADDLWFPEKLEDELRFMEERQAAFAFTSYYFGDENGKSTGRIVKAPESLTFEKALTRTVIFTSTVLIDLQQIPKELAMMPEIASEDTATWWKILKSGYVAEGLNRPLVVYRRPETSLSSNKGKAVKRIWNLYRQIAGIGRVRAVFCLAGWAVRATLRRL